MGHGFAAVFLLDSGQSAKVAEPRPGGSFVANTASGQNVQADCGDQARIASGSPDRYGLAQTPSADLATGVGARGGADISSIAPMTGLATAAI